MAQEAEQRSIEMQKGGGTVITAELSASPTTLAELGGKGLEGLFVVTDGWTTPQGKRVYGVHGLVTADKAQNQLGEIGLPQPRRRDYADYLTSLYLYPPLMAFSALDTFLYGFSLMEGFPRRQPDKVLEGTVKSDERRDVFTTQEGQTIYRESPKTAYTIEPRTNRVARLLRLTKRVPFGEKGSRFYISRGDNSVTGGRNARLNIYNPTPKAK